MEKNDKKPLIYASCAGVIFLGCMIVTEQVLQPGYLLKSLIKLTFHSPCTMVVKAGTGHPM